MLKVYIAGRLNDMACDYVKNMHNMMRFAQAIRFMGYAVYVPCLDVLMGLMAGDYDYDDYFNNNLEFMKACDVVFVCPNSEGSVGVRAEIDIAKRHGIPVTTDINDLKTYTFGGLNN